MVGPATSAAAAATAVVAAIATEKAQNQQDWTTLIQKIDFTCCLSMVYAIIAGGKMRLGT